MYLRGRDECRFYENLHDATISLKQLLAMSSGRELIRGKSLFTSFSSEASGVPRVADMAKLMLREMTSFHMVHNNVIFFGTLSYIWWEIFRYGREVRCRGPRWEPFCSLSTSLGLDLVQACALSCQVRCEIRADVAAVPGTMQVWLLVHESERERCGLAT